MRALVSVSDKSGLVEFVGQLQELGWEIIATGGTQRLLEEKGIKTIGISEVTGFPEICDGRVKTLHPKVHGGLLARRDCESHLEALRENGISFIDLVCVNLYPFRQTISREGVSMEDAIENIDIGGPSMLRSAAKNYRDVTVVCNDSNCRQQHTLTPLNTTLALRHICVKRLVFRRSCSSNSMRYRHSVMARTLIRVQNFTATTRPPHFRLPMPSSWVARSCRTTIFRMQMLH